MAMGYEQALEKAWKEISGLGGETRLSVKFLNDNYSVNLEAKTILSESCNIPPKIHLSIILLHYLAKNIKSSESTALSGEWIDFNQLEGGEEYYPTFKKRTINHILKKYGDRPDFLAKIPERLPAKITDRGDVGIIVYPFANVPILITIWRADEEFGPDANILFDKTISSIFCTEDAVVLTETVVHSL